MSTIFAIGPLPIRGDVIGGTKVSFENFCQALEKDSEVDLTVLNISRPLRDRGRFQKLLLNLIVFSKVIVFSFWGSFKYDAILWNVSPTAIPSSGLFFWLVTRFGRAKIILRIFGGDLDKVLESRSRTMQNILAKTILNTDALLLQTRYLVEKLSNLNKNVLWFPTTRNLTIVERDVPTRCTEFLYLGQLRKEKGIPEIIQAARDLGRNINVSICGPLMNGYDPRSDFSDAGIKYLQPIDNKDVEMFLRNYDALLFPSYYEGEGYPGVVIEALQSGLPVICTNWKSLPEIIKNDENGIIIDIKNSSALGASMTRLNKDPDYFHKLVFGARKSGNDFSTARAVSRLKELLFRLHQNTRP